MTLTIYNYVSIISMLIMTLLILVQTRGASLGAGIGAGGEVNTERRGTDKTIYQLTIFFAMLFGLSLILGIVLPTK
jgi:preprotein translocase subunit SecG